MMKAINRFPHFFNASMHADITEDQTEKKKNQPYIFAFFVSHLFQIFT